MFVNITINVYKCVVRIPVLRFLKKGFGRIQSAGDLWGNFQKITVKIHSFKKGPNPPPGGTGKGRTTNTATKHLVIRRKHLPTADLHMCS